MNSIDSDFLFVLDYVFAEYAPPTDLIREIWFDQFQKYDRKLLLTAAKTLKTKQLYGAPKVNDMHQVLAELVHPTLPDSLRWQPEEALCNSESNKLLIQDAREYATRVCPAIDPKRQFESIEEMHREEIINRKIWEREFKKRFESMQKLSLTKINLGEQPIKAVCTVIASQGSVDAAITAQRALIMLGEQKNTRLIQ